MVNTPSANLKILKSDVRSPFPDDLVNGWGSVLTDEIETIDRVIGEVCSPDQITTIRQRLHEGPPGLLLGRFKDG